MIPPMQVNKSVHSLDDFRSQAPVQRGHHRHRAARCLICTVMILAVGALAAGGAIVVREYVLSRAYSPATCRVVNVTYAAQDAECTFCEGSVDKGQSKTTACSQVRYPCARVHVDFLVDGDRRVGQGVLYDDTMQASDDEAKCSLKVCHKSATENRDEVDRYVGQFHTGRTFACFYNAETLDHAIGHKVYTRSDVIHCLLWPLLVIAVCVGIFLLVELSSRGLVQLPCGTKDKRSVAAHHAAASPPPPAAASSNTVSPH